MAFFEERFPDRIAAGGRGGPSWKTSKAVTSSGFRNTNKEWKSPLHLYNVAQGIKTEADFEQVRDFFMVVYGAYDGFRFKDYTDYQAGTRGVCTLITGSTYQFYKTYAFGVRSFSRKILKPVAGTIAIIRTRASVPTDITGSSTIDTTNGQVTVTGHVGGDTYTWTGEFDVPCAFADDLLEADVLGSVHNMLLSWSSIRIEEIRIRE
jgi:uncharacterized protein (TIGR02217 family)